MPKWKEINNNGYDSCIKLLFRIKRLPICQNKSNKYTVEGKRSRRGSKINLKIGALETIAGDKLTSIYS